MHNNIASKITAIALLCTVAVPATHSMNPEQHQSAITRHDVELVRKLLIAGTSYNRRNVEALQGVESTYTKAIRDLCITNATSDLMSPRYASAPLHQAVASFSNPAAAVEALLRMGADPNVRNSTNETPLHIAARSRRYGIADTIRVLMEYGADPDARDDHYQTPLQHAERGTPRGRPLAKIIRETPPSPYLRDLSGRSPLHIALYYKNNRMVRRMLEHGAELTEDGDPPHWRL